MLSITIIAAGKIKEKYFTEAISEYSKRLLRYCKLKITEVKDEETPDNPSERERQLVLEREGDRILEKLPKGAYVIALCVEGKMKSSEELAKLIESVPLNGTGEIVFVIGGSMGLSDEVKSKADLKLSFSPMTFPHRLMRVILLEQIYRAFNIISGGKYHK